MRVLVTGATGFVGQAVCRSLECSGADVVAALRAPDRLPPPGAAPTVVGEIGLETDWGPHLTGVDAIIHLAARVHMMRDTAADPLAAFRRVNRDGTLGLARAAAAAGVRRLVFASSVKVMGEGRERPYAPDDPPAPADPYGVSKWEAEQGILQISRETGLEIVVVRPPLIYGPGVRANFLKLLELVDRGVPLPLGAVRNRRSMVFVDNLADALRVATEARVPSATAYFVSDGEDVSTAQLVHYLAAALGRRARLLPVPPSWIRSGLRLLGKRNVAERILESLTVDASAFRGAASWTPPHTMAQGIDRTVAWYRERPGQAGQR